MEERSVASSQAYLTRCKKEPVWTETYKAAIKHHQNAIEDKVVLDVGCGTGILSIFCAEAGAKRVYAVEASHIARRVESIVQANNLSHIVMVLHGRIEDVDLKEKVDVIVSDWMGSMLLYESMLGSVIFARDRWLKHGGLMLPSNAMLYVAPFTNPNKYREEVECWIDVSGINMSAMISLAKQIAFEEPSVETITNQNILASSQVVKYIDCYSITIPQLKSITTSFKFNPRVQAPAPLHGFAFWFDVDFSGAISTSAVDYHLVDRQRRNRTNPNDAPPLLSTSPEHPPTHWKQTLIYLYDPIEVVENQLIEGSVTLSQRQENARFLNVGLKFTLGDQSYLKNVVLR